MGELLPFPAKPREAAAPVTFQCTKPSCRVLVFEDIPRLSGFFDRMGVYVSTCPACRFGASRRIPGDTSDT